MTKKIFLIAGEASGDLLGGKLMREIKTQLRKQNETAEFVGVGGELMQKEGLHSIFPMSDLSIMGFVEVLPHIFKLLGRIKQTADEITAQKPDLIITIDAPDFNFRVMEKLRDYKSAKKIHLIAPSVWAYREGRAKKIARLYDLLLTILPFEPPYFTRYGLKSVFIGHPIIENAPILENKGEISRNFRQKYGLYADDCLIYVTPGSRISEVKKIFPEFIAALNQLNKRVPNIAVVIATVEKTRTKIDEMAKMLNVKHVIVGQDEKSDALFAGDFALAKSGTNTLEISLYNLPMLVSYKVNLLTYILAKMLLKIKFANLINLILDKEVIPELLQQNCSSEVIATKLEDLMKNKNLHQKQIQESQVALQMLGLGQDNATKKAVEEILSL